MYILQQRMRTTVQYIRWALVASVTWSCLSTNLFLRLELPRRYCKEALSPLLFDSSAIPGKTPQPLSTVLKT